MLQQWKRRAIWAWPIMAALAGAISLGQTTAPAPGTPPTARGGRGSPNVRTAATRPSAPPFVREIRPEIAALPPAPLTPHNAADLKAIQDRVEAVVKMALPATVGLTVADGQGSGIIVSKDGYVLTAGHVSGTPHDVVFITLSNGVRVRGESLGANNGIDSGMVKITTPGDYPFVPMGTTAKLVSGQWVVAMGHPGGYQVSRPPVVRLGRILNMAGGENNDRGFIGTDCPLINGDSGGPLFDLDGRVIGINSRIGEATTMNIHVPIDTFAQTWDRLAGGDEWNNNNVFARGGGGLPRWFGGGDNGGRGPGGRAEPAPPPAPPPVIPVLGFSFTANAKGLEILRIRAGFPVENSGLQVGDIVTKLDGKPIKTESDLESQVALRQPGDLITLDILRDNETRKISFKVGAGHGD